MTTRAPNIGNDRRRQRRALDADLREAAQIAETATHLVESLIARAHVAAAESMADGLPGGSDSPSVSGTGVDTSTATEAAAAQRSRLQWALDQITADLRTARCAIVRADRRAATLASLTVPADPHALAPGQGECAACGRWVAGTATDRLKASYCEADYRAWKRAGSPDRAAFERQRRQLSPDA